MKEAFKKLCSEGDDTEAWRELNEAALTQVMQFNRRRQGEISKVKITDYNSQHTTVQDDLSQSLSPLKQKLCHSLRRMEIIGKRGRTVPVILTKDMTRWVDLLLATRDIIGVNPDNKFLFPRCHYGSIGHIRGCDTLRNASEACGAKFPQLLRSTKLRKQIGTLSQLLNLKDNELDILATFMGHDIRVHREYYRLPDETLQVAKISKVLLSLENGQFSENQGRSLDDITVDVDEELDVEVGACEENESNDDLNEEYENPPKRKGRRKCSHDSGEMSSEEEEDAEDKGTKRKPKKRPWSEAERDAVIRHFRSHVALNKIPRKGKVDRCIGAEPVLKRRSWKNIKDFVRNKSKSVKSKALFS